MISTRWSLLCCAVASTSCLPPEAWSANPDATDSLAPAETGAATETGSNDSKVTCEPVNNCEGVPSAGASSCKVTPSPLGQAYIFDGRSVTSCDPLNGEKARAAGLGWQPLGKLREPCGLGTCVGVVSAANVCTVWCYAGPGKGKVLQTDGRCACPADEARWNGTWR